ncbi:MAG: PqqD family protein [Planctomycetia bacterium]|jgi:hypothetical protein|nr:PqqD family protein [Planctomycetia bacterium]
MTRQPHYRINEPNVVAENFGDEIVAVNLDTGVYYSMHGSAATIWKLLQEGQAVDHIAAALAAAHDAAPATISADVDAFLDRLADEKLIIGTASPAVVPALSLPSGERQPYSAPTMDLHSDMQDILLLDPVHDVDEAGWPLAADLEQTPRVA